MNEPLYIPYSDAMMQYGVMYHLFKTIGIEEPSQFLGLMATKTLPEHIDNTCDAFWHVTFSKTILEYIEIEMFIEVLRKTASILKALLNSDKLCDCYINLDFIINSNDYELMKVIFDTQKRGMIDG